MIDPAFRIAHEAVKDALRAFDEDPRAARPLISRAVRVLGERIEALEKAEKAERAAAVIDPEKTPVMSAGEVREAHQSSSQFSAAEVRRILEEGKTP